MSGWWDAASLASIATNAIKTAQKKIDKVLDIKEQEEAAAALHQQAVDATLHQAENAESNDNDDISSERSASRVTSSPKPFAAVKMSPSPVVNHDDLPPESEVQDLTAESSSLITPTTSELLLIKAPTPDLSGTDNKLGLLSPGQNSVEGLNKGMISSSEDTLVPENQQSTAQAQVEQMGTPRSIDSPAVSEANSSYIGSEVIRVEVAPSTSSDIEIVSTPSSCVVENYTAPSQDSSRHFRPLVPAGLTVDISQTNRSDQSLNTPNTIATALAPSPNDQTAAQLMRQLAEITRALEKKDTRILELSEENTLLHTQLAEIRRQMDSQAAQDAQFGADTVRLLKNEIKDRDQVISELREEGEKLSRQQAQGSALIKKLRAKEKENDGQLAEAQRKNEELQAKIIQLERNLTQKLEGERQSAEMVQQMTSAVKRMEREVSEKQQQLSEAKADLESLEKRVSTVGDSSKEREIKLLERIDQLGEVVRELEERALTNERQRKAEIMELEAKLEQANSYAEELREGATSAAKPVVKQLETLQQSYAMAAKNWNETEKNMSTKLSQLEGFLQQAEQRARESENNAVSSEKKRLELEKGVDSLKTELTRVQANMIQLEADRDIWKRRVSNLESMCEQERARAAGYERRATESESRLSISSSTSQRRYNDLEASLQKMERDHQELTVRYEKLLEMYGEKAEEADELRADVSELRDVFRQHFANYGSPQPDNNNNNNASPAKSTTGDNVR